MVPTRENSTKTLLGIETSLTYWGREALMDLRENSTKTLLGIETYILTRSLARSTRENSTKTLLGIETPEPLLQGYHITRKLDQNPLRD